MSRTVPVRLNVNGVEHHLEVEPRLLLVHAIRDHLGLTGTHVGCDTSNCGACTIHMDGRAVKSCTVLAVQADGAALTTIEGMATENELHPLQEAFWNDHGLQCGYCTPGMIMAAAGLLAENPNPTEEEVRHGLEGNLCRCTGYHNIVKAVLDAAKVKGAASRRSRGCRHERDDRIGRSRRTASPHVGQSLRRKEDPRLITGRASYVDDINLVGQLWGAWVRSPEAHAKIVSIDTSAAKARDGVVAVYTNEDLDMEAGLPMAWVPPGVTVNTPDHWVLAKGEVKHVGDPVALVIGDDRYAVVDAAEDVVVEYDPLPVVTDPEKALEDGSPAGPREVRDQQGVRLVARRWRPRGRLRRGRRHHRASHRQPSHGRWGDRAARGAGRVSRRPSDRLELHPGSALSASVPRDPARRRRGQGPRDRSGGRGRFRLQAQYLRRGDRLRMGGAQARAPGEVDRDAFRGD